MKKNIKNIICSLMLAIAMIISSNFPLAYYAVDGIKNISIAEYKSKDFVTPYEFTSNSGWTRYTVDDTDIKNTFGSYSIDDPESDNPNDKIQIDGSSVSVNLLNLKKLDQYKPATKYDGTKTTLEEGETQSSETDNYAMRIIAHEAPVASMVEQKDDKNNTLYEYDLVDGTEDKKLFDTKPSESDGWIYEEVEGGYNRKKAVKEAEFVTYYYKTNSSLNLNSNSWYVITAWIYTSTGTKASLNVTGTDFEAKQENIDTQNTWKQLYLFIETSSDSKNNVNLSFYFGNDTCIIDGVDKDKPENYLETKTSGVAYLDNVCVKSISQTDYNNLTIDGESNNNVTPTRYSVRHDLKTRLEEVNADFQNALSIYGKLYGEDGYTATDANAMWQYYINKYTSDSSTEKLTENQLANLRRAYGEKLTSETILETKEFETTKEVKDEDGNPIPDGDGNNKTEVVAGPNTFSKENKALKLVNKSEKYSLGILSKNITIDQFGYYKLSLYVKGTKSTDKATVKLVSFIKTGSSASEGAIQVKSQTVDAYTEKSDTTNNWTEVAFYIQGSSFRSTTFQIALLADVESTVYFDNIRLESITSSTYSNATSSKKLDLSPSSTTITNGITNGYFDYIKTENVDPSKNKAPYIPASWTKLDDVSEDVTSGIVSSLTGSYNAIKENLGNAENPITKTIVNGEEITLPKTNVLAIYAPSKDEKTHMYGYKSTDFSLSSNSVYKVSFEAYAAKGEQADSDADFAGDIFAKLVYSDKTISEFNTTILSTDTKGVWQKYTFVVRTGSSSRTCKIHLGVDNAVGTVFFQKVGYTKLAEKTVDDEKISVDSQFDKIAEQYPSVDEQIAGFTRIVDIEGGPFSMISKDKVEGKDYYSSLSHSLKEAGKDEDPIIQGELGIVDTTKDLSGFTGLTAEYLNNPAVKSKFAMLIHNNENYATVVNPNNTVSLSSSSYYQITFYAKTNAISEGNGLTVKMDKISVTFDNINTTENDYGDLTETNGYKKFTVLVKTGSSTISGLTISYELGSKGKEFTGSALVSGLNVTKLKDEAAYNEVVETVDTTDLATVLKDFTSKEKDSKAEDEADNLTLATFFLVFSSILLVAALVVALVAVYIKRSPKLQHLTTNTNNSSKDSKVVKNKGVDTTPKDGFV